MTTRDAVMLACGAVGGWLATVFLGGTVAWVIVAAALVTFGIIDAKDRT